MTNLEILQILERYGDYVSMGVLMEELEVSKRTIQYALKELQIMGSHNGFQIQTRRGLGYLLVISNYELYSKLSNKVENNDIDESIASIISFLALNNEFITVDHLVEVFLIGRTTILNRRGNIEKRLAQYNLSLERKVHYGWKIEGNLNNRVNLLVDLLKEDTWLRRYAKQHVSEKQVVSFETTLLNELSSLNFEINYAELEAVKKWMYVYELLKDNFDTYNQEKLRKNAVSDVCDTIFQKMEWDRKGIFFSYFVDLIERSIRVDILDSKLTDEVRGIILEFLKAADIRYDTHFEEDLDFMRLLTTHVSLLIQRLQNDTSHSNALTSEIAFKYPTMFSIALKFAKTLEGHYSISINPEEVAFIAAYFAVHMEKESNEKLNQFNRIAVVCGTGGGSAMFIKYKVETFFPQAYVETFSFVEMLKLEDFDPNLIFTIKNFEYEKDIPIIKISELVDDIQLVRIQNHLKSDFIESAMSSGDRLQDLFNPNIWNVVETNTRYEDLLESMAHDLVVKGYAEKTYPQSVLERESHMSTIYTNGVAMPHPMQMNAIRNAISVSVVKSQCENTLQQDVKLVFMMCLNHTGYDALKDITKELYDLMNDRFLVMKLWECSDFEEFMMLIKRRKQWNF